MALINASITMLVLAVFLNAGANLFLSLANSEKSLPASNYFFWVLAIIFFAGNFFFYGKALTEIKISYAYPVLVGGTTLLIFVMDWYFFGHKLGTQSLIGALFLIIGLLIINQK